MFMWRYRIIATAVVGVVLACWGVPARAMLLLDATTKSVEVVLAGTVTTNQLPFTADYADITTTTFAPGHNDGTTNNVTAVTMVAAPGASTQRQVKFLSIYNADTASATVTVRYNNNGTTRILGKVALAAGDTLQYTDGNGFTVITDTGGIISESTGVTAHSLLGASHDDTTAQAVTRGSLVYGDSTPKWNELTIGAANRLLRSDGTDVAWAQVVLTTDVTGTLPVANGGTGLTGGTSGGVLAYTAAGTLASSAALTANALVLGGGAGGAPS